MKDLDAISRERQGRINLSQYKDLIETISKVEYKKISKKEFSNKAGITVDTIMKGISRNSIPQLDTAQKIAKVLNVSLEYLMQENINHENEESKGEMDLADVNHQVQLYRKHAEIINNLEKMDEKKLKALSSFIAQLI